MLPDGFLAFINEHQLFTRSDRVLLAVSGGIDSMVLAALMQQSGFPFGVAHINFGLRGSDSDADAAFVENMALTCGVPFHLTRFNTAAEAMRRGESTQVTARELRYTWFHELQRQHGYVAVATAHHLNDVLETMLLNLTRGTGLAGLRGMPIQSDAYPTRPRVVRPLWFAPRRSIEAYAQENGLLWREDSSNASDAYSRNQIRHHVVPVLEQINPGLLQTLPRSLSQLQAAERIVQEDLAASFRQCTRSTQDGFVLTISALLQFSEPLFRLGEWVRPYGFTPDVVTQCWESVGPNRVEGRNGQVFLAPAHQLVHDRGQLWLLPRRSPSALFEQLPDWPAAPIELGSDGQLAVDRISRADWDGQWPAEQTTALLDADSLPFPWTIRTWRKGDRFSPLGMNGSRLVSDFLAGAKLPFHQRERVLVLESGDRIGWILGLRVAQDARISQKTRQIAILSWQQSS